MFIKLNPRVKHKIISFVKTKINYSFQSMMNLNRILTFFKILYHKFFMNLTTRLISACWETWRIVLIQQITSNKQTKNLWSQNFVRKLTTNYKLFLKSINAHFARNNSIHNKTNLINYFAIVKLPHVRNV